MSESEEGSRGDDVTPLLGKLLPLNSRRLTAAYLKHIAQSLELPTAGSADETRQLIDGKLQETRDSANVLVVVDETASITVKLSLMDDEGIFHEAAPFDKPPKEPQPDDDVLQRLADAEQKNEQLAAESDLAAAQENLDQERAETTRLQGELRLLSASSEVSKLQDELKKERDKGKRMWRMNCAQVAEQEKLLGEREDEIKELKQKLAECMKGDGSIVHHSESGSESDTHELLPTRERLPPAKRRGKAPPVDTFTGEDPELRFEDWLPALQRAARWNDWGPEEQLIQLAGHLRGRAWQEWNLLDEEKETFSDAVKAMKEVLGPGSKILAAQDFRHTIQEESESVSVFVCRLERTFRIAYGSDKLSPETRGAFLYGQLQEGLRQSLMHSPNVSGALTYKELVMAAKNEERRQSELKKCKQYQSASQKPPASSSATTKKPQTQLSNQANQPKQSSTEMTKKYCDFYHKTGHLRRECRHRIQSESGGRSSRAQGQSTPPSAKANTKTVQSSPSPAAQQAAVDPLSLLYSSSSDESESDHIRVVRVNDGGSQPHYAEVQLQGVPAQGIVDSGADITIMGAELFQKVAAANKIRKKAFHKPDKIPHTYDQRTFTLDGYLQLDISFGEKIMQTRVYMYVKMDAHDQLLLSEGVCRQLGIITYHPDVKPKQGGPQNEKESEGTASVPTIRVCLLHAVRVPAGQSTLVPVQFKGSDFSGRSMLLERDPSLEESTGLQFEDALLQPTADRIAYVRVCNSSGFTSVIGKDTVLGEAVEATEITPGDPPPKDSPEQPEIPEIRQVSSDSDDKRKQELLEKLGEPDLPPTDKTRLTDLLTSYHLAFSLGDGDRGETDLVEMDIDTGDANPRNNPSEGCHLQPEARLPDNSKRCKAMV